MEEKKPVEVPFGVAASVVKSQFEPTVSIRVSVEDLTSLGMEMKMLREQVTLLQASGTAQLSASRLACFEAAAMLCDQVAGEESHVPGAVRCAEAIRKVADKLR